MIQNVNLLRIRAGVVCTAQPGGSCIWALKILIVSHASPVSITTYHPVRIYSKKMLCLQQQQLRHQGGHQEGDDESCMKKQKV